MAPQYPSLILSYRNHPNLQPPISSCFLRIERNCVSARVGDGNASMAVVSRSVGYGALLSHVLASMCRAGPSIRDSTGIPNEEHHIN